jgi:hypothetical protein
MPLALTMVHYCGDVKLEQVRPLPDISRCVGLPELNAITKDPTNLNIAEEVARDNRKLFEAEFLKCLANESKGQSMFNDFEEALGRLLLSKSLGNVKFNHNVSGKFSVSKAKALQQCWVNHLEKEHDELSGLAGRFGLLPDDDNDGIAGQEEVLMCMDVFVFIVLGSESALSNDLQLVPSRSKNVCRVVHDHPKLCSMEIIAKLC